MLNTGMPYLVPFISALIGWLIAKGTISLYVAAVVKRKTNIASAVGAYAEQQFSLATLEQQLTEPANIEKILPFAEEHIDQFLRVKLPAAMPMLAMFISDKLVADMKAIFMKELEELIPALIGQYFANVKSSVSIGNIISTKLNTISTDAIRPLLKKQLRVVIYACLVTGFLCGCFYIFLTPVA